MCLPVWAPMKKEAVWEASFVLMRFCNNSILISLSMIWVMVCEDVKFEKSDYHCMLLLNSRQVSGGIGSSIKTKISFMWIIANYGGHLLLTKKTVINCCGKQKKIRSKQKNVIRKTTIKTWKILFVFCVLEKLLKFKLSTIIFSFVSEK